jgi:hypothetical protein
MSFVLLRLMLPWRLLVFLASVVSHQLSEFILRRLLQYIIFNRHIVLYIAEINTVNWTLSNNQSINQSINQLTEQISEQSTEQMTVIQDLL